MKKYLSVILMGTVLTVIAFNAPFMASAKTKHAQADTSVTVSTSTDSHSDRRCIIPFGHLIAPGWLKKHDRATTTPSGCLLPWGRGKKDHGTSTASTTIPFTLRISDVDTSVASTSVKISWDTNISADSRVYYSTSTPVVVGATSTASVGSTAQVRDHNVTVNGLATSTTYYFLLKSTDTFGNTATKDEFHLTTSSM